MENLSVMTLETDAISAENAVVSTKQPVFITINDLLPLELLIRIMWFLKLEDRIAAMRACRRWKTAVDASCDWYIPSNLISIEEFFLRAIIERPIEPATRKVWAKMLGITSADARGKDSKLSRNYESMMFDCSLLGSLEFFQ